MKVKRSQNGNIPLPFTGVGKSCSSGISLIVGEPKSRIVQKHTFFAPERYTAGFLYTDSLNSA